MPAVDSPMVMDEEMEVGEKMETATPSTNVIQKKSTSEETKRETVYMLDMEEYKDEIYSYLVEAQVILVKNYRILNSYTCSYFSRKNTFRNSTI